FREIVLTHRNIQKFEEGMLAEERTLFREGGFAKETSRDALRAQEIDTWNPEMPYLYARGLWREYVSKGAGPGLTEGGLTRSELPIRIAAWLVRAIRLDPTNRFLRATLAGVLTEFEKQNPEYSREIVRLLTVFPPRSAYGQIRTAERLVSRDETFYGELALRHYGEALDLAVTDLQMELRRTRFQWVSEPRPRITSVDAGPLAESLVQRTTDGILRLARLADYAAWSAYLPVRPAGRWLLGNRLVELRDAAAAEADAFRRRPGYATQTRDAETRAGQLDAAARKEYQYVLDRVRYLLSAAEAVTPVRRVWDNMCPLVRVDPVERLLLASEIGYAARILDRRARELMTQAERDTTLGQAERNAGNVQRAKVYLDRAARGTAQARQHFDEEADLYRTQIRRRPREIQPRLDLAGLLIELGETHFDEANEQLSAVLSLEPMHAGALALRARIRQARGETER
ncbi:MAG TPA: hypothetical protein VMY39_09795, partial [Planctomycetota bacterium]|nr:hypothetical protein [Planctomycetota bacterium]